MIPVKNQENIFVLIPVLNEEASIGPVIKDIPRDMIREVVVIDNGSSDNSRANAAKAGATVLVEPKRGYGHALMKGIDYLADKSPDILLFLDGDYSDHPEEIPEVLAPILTDGVDLVIGSRELGIHEPGALLPQARFGNWLSTRLIRLFWKYRFTDLGPFRAIRYGAFQKMKMRELTFGWTVEMQIKAAKLKLKSTEVPVRYRIRVGQSKVSGTVTGSFKAGIGILRTIFSQLIRY